MTIQEAIRQKTLPFRDALAHADKQAREAQSRREAAEAQMKRATTEITRQRALENERKRLVKSASEKVAEAQRIVDDIERQRADALERFYRIQEEEGQLDKDLKEARHQTQVAVMQVNHENKSIQESAIQLARLREEVSKRSVALTKGILEALDLYLQEQTERVQNAFIGQEEKNKALRQLEEFKKARHQDRQIGDLCDQRDELRKMISTAMVPAIKKMLQDQIAKIELELVKRYPGALSIQETVPRDTTIEELHYYADKNDKAIFLIPIVPSVWEEIRKNVNPATTRAMRMLWSMIKQLGLTPNEGTFALLREWPVFHSTFDIEDATVLQGFTVRTADAPILQFVLSALPHEVQEALSNED